MLSGELSPALAERVLARPGVEPRAGAFVLYWMRVAMRAEENPALGVALAVAKGLGVPCFVYQGLAEGGPYANDRHHRFILEGARALGPALAALGVGYAFHLERPGHRGPHLRDLARQAALVVTDACPVPFLERWVRAVEAVAPVWRVDASCIVPMGLSPGAPTRAFAFREGLAEARATRLAQPWETAAGPGARLPDLPFEPVDFSVDLSALVAACDIDHEVAAVADTVGGTAAGMARWAAWRDRHLDRYHQRRNDAASGCGTSRMSAYLHYGMVSPHRLAREAAARGSAGASKFLDELLVWRELAWHWCRHTPNPEGLAALPAWAQATLAAHARDPREVIGKERLARGRSGDRLWDLCQASLLRHGELHNNVRMSWGKAVLGWTASPQAALEVMVDLNHRFALDGRDPASYGGLLYCLGLFDRPFKPATPVLGEVRSRDLASHAARLDLDRLADRCLRPRRSVPAQVAVIGAGMAGLVCARVLTDHGLTVTVFDKGRGPGGRMSSRRVAPGDGPSLSFDHGAQFFQVRGRHFARWVQGWAEAGVVAPWEGRFGRGVPGAISPERPTAIRWVGAPRMSALSRHLAADLRGIYGIRVSELVAAREGFTLEAEGGPFGPFDAVVVATPAPQAAPLLARVPAFAQAAAAVTPAPCWAVMARFAEPLEFPFDGVQIEAGPLAFVARQGSRPGRSSAPAWVIQARPAWSQAHLEEEPRTAGAALVEAFLELTGAPAPVAWEAHRWRFGFGRGEGGALWDPQQRLGACGDWLGAGRIEDAWASGVALAGRMLASL